MGGPPTSSGSYGIRAADRPVYARLSPAGVTYRLGLGGEWSTTGQPARQAARLGTRKVRRRRMFPTVPNFTRGALVVPANGAGVHLMKESICPRPPCLEVTSTIKASSSPKVVQRTAAVGGVWIRSPLPLLKFAQKSLCRMRGSLAATEVARVPLTVKMHAGPSALSDLFSERRRTSPAPIFFTAQIS